MYETSVKSNVDGITHTVTDKIIKMLKSTMDKVQTERDHSENATHSLWFTKLTGQCLRGRATQLHTLTQHM